MHRDDPIRIDLRADRFFGGGAGRVDARRQFRASMIFMTLLVGILGAGILANMVNALGPIAH